MTSFKSRTNQDGSDLSCLSRSYCFACDDLHWVFRTCCWQCWSRRFSTFRFRSLLRSLFSVAWRGCALLIAAVLAYNIWLASQLQTLGRVGLNLTAAEFARQSFPWSPHFRKAPAYVALDLLRKQPDDKDLQEQALTWLNRALDTDPNSSDLLVSKYYLLTTSHAGSTDKIEATRQKLKQLRVQVE